MTSTPESYDELCRRLWGPSFDEAPKPKANGAHRTEATAEGVDVEARKQAELFLRTLEPTTDQHCFVSIGETKARKGTVHEMHGSLAELWPRLVELNKLGDAIYCTVNGTDGLGRKAYNVVKVRALWREDDDGVRHSKPLPIEPCLIVETSPGRAHEYVLADDLTRDDHRSAMASMVELYGSDPSARDLSRILRVPGFLHQKGKPYLVSIVGGRATKPGYTRRTADEVRKAFPPLPPKPETHSQTRAEDVNLAHVSEALRYVTDFDNRQTWLTVGAALHDVDTDEARELWDTWSQQSGKYDPDDQQRVWDSFNHGRDRRVTVGSIYRLAAKGGWKPPADFRGDPTSGFTGDEDLTPDPLAHVRLVRVSSFADKPVPPRESHVAGIIPAHNVTYLGGDGGTGKSLLAAQLLVSTAVGRTWIGQDVHKQGPAVYVGAEDDSDEMHRRFADIAESEGIRLADLHDLHLLCLAGQDAVLGAVNRNEIIEPTALFKRVRELILDVKPALIAFDTLADFFAGNENSRPQARQFVGMLRGLTLEARSTSILLAHPSLSGMASGTGASGSTGWSNSVRSRLYLTRVEDAERRELDPDARKLRVMKANYSQVGLEVGVRWQQGVFVADTGQKASDRKAAAAALAKARFFDLMRKYTAHGLQVGPNSGPNYAPAKFAKANGIRKDQFAQAMHELLDAGHIRIASVGRPSKEKQVLVLA
jgi:RecA-family ATPase